MADPPQHPVGHRLSPVDQDGADRRDETADRRDLAADARDDDADRRDAVAVDRDRDLRRRDLAAQGRDAVADHRDADDLRREQDADRQELRTTEQAAAARQVVDTRRVAAVDRQRAALDREAGRAERAAAERDRINAQADRSSGATEREAAGGDRAAAARDRHHASLDSLTGAYLRGAGLLQLERELVRNRRTGAPLTVAFLDVDHLKVVNDTRGHDAGDRLLARVAAALRHRLRTYDLVIRYGGDEFVCVLAGLDAFDAEQRFALVSEDLAEHGSVTVGVVTAGPDDDCASVLARADAAMFALRADRLTDPD